MPPSPLALPQATGPGPEQDKPNRPEQLSSGERQRVALARALFLNPPGLIADEPTGNLDSGTGKKVLELLFEEQARRNITLLLVTHDERLAAQCDRVLHMGDGMIVRDSAIPVPDRFMVRSGVGASARLLKRSEIT